jgi:hypothetical protein
MPTYLTCGRTVTTGNTNVQQNQGSNNQYGFKITMTEAGQIQRLNVYCSGQASSYTGKLVLWKSDGTVLRSEDVTFPTGSVAVNSQSWLQVTLTTPYNAASGEVLYVGFWRPSASSAIFSYINSGGVISPGVGSGQANVASPGTLATGSTTTGQMSAYVEYVKGGIKIYSSGSAAYKRRPVKVYSTSAVAWKWRPLKVYDLASTSWKRRA